MKREEIKTFEDLVIYLSEDNDGQICHYTSYESLVQILKYRSFRLTRYDLMNDYAEKQLSCCLDGDSRYIMSFAAKRESVAMWALYGKSSSLRLRLEFSAKNLINSVDSNFFFDSKKTAAIPLYCTKPVFAEYSKKGYTYSDVVYYDRKKHALRLGGKPLTNITVSDYMIKKLAGTIKYDAWEYEKESRLSVILHNEKPHHKSDHSDVKYIYAGLEDDFIKSLTIRFSPWINEDVQKELEASLNSLAEKTLTYKKSDLQGEISPM